MLFVVLLSNSNLVTIG